LPSLLWFAVGERMSQGNNDLLRGIALGEGSAIPQLRDYAMWYGPQVSDAGRSRVLELLTTASPEEQRRRLLLMADGLAGRRGLAMPAEWSVVGPVLYASDDPAIRNAAWSLGAIFADIDLFAQMRETLRSNATVDAKAQALAILAYDSSELDENAYLPLLDEPGLRERVLPMLRRASSIRVAQSLLEHLPNWEGRLREQTLEILCGRVAWANELLTAIEDERVSRELLTAYYARQMASLGDDGLNERLASIWGRLGSSSEEKLAEIERLATAYTEAPLWAYDQGAGRVHFQKLCANCHTATETQARIGPQLEGTGSKGVHYILENVIDPNAVVGKDFQATIIETIEGRAVTGVIVDENETAVTIRTSTDTEVIPVDDIDRRAVSPNSFMPEGILEPLNDRERIELLKYLMGL
ncbi:MAG: hypothetical protein KDA83_21705, partial [Planctomycetales bacterium]|nr:hypothetical protein [Planctomycetales bacterium]